MLLDSIEQPSKPPRTNGCKQDKSTKGSLTDGSIRRACLAAEDASVWSHDRGEGGSYVPPNLAACLPGRLGLT